MAEGNAGSSSLVFTVTLSNPSASPVNVNVATSDGTATLADADYTASSNPLGFDALQTSQQFTISVTGDLAAEADETIHLTLTSASGATIADDTAVGTIINDDTPLTFGFNKTVAIAGISPSCTALNTIKVPLGTRVVYLLHHPQHQQPKSDHAYAG